MSYKIFNAPNGNVFIVTNNDKTFIPIDESNLDYQDYLKWLAEGNVPGEFFFE